MTNFTAIFSELELNKLLSVMIMFIVIICNTLQWCETQKGCNRLGLMDILVKPMQRLTKYSLLLKAIQKHTEIEEHRQSLELMVCMFISICTLFILQDIFTIRYFNNLFFLFWQDELLLKKEIRKWLLSLREILVPLYRILFLITFIDQYVECT